MKRLSLQWRIDVYKRQVEDGAKLIVNRLKVHR